MVVDPPISSQEKEVADMTIKTEAKDNNLSSDAMNLVPGNYVADIIEEESSNDLDSIPCSVKTKPYYSINAKLNQRERKPVIGNTPPIKQIHSNYGGNIVEESPPNNEDRNSVLENAKPPSILDANFKFLSGSLSNRTSQTCNKASVTCLICGKQLSNQYNLRVHMETHSNSSYSCTACSHVSRSRDALRKHVSYRHPVTSPQKRPRYNSSKP